MSPHINPAGIIELITQSGWVAKLVLIFLLSASLFCWAIIISKWRTLSLAQKQDEKFLALFWKGKSIEEIVNNCENLPNSPIASIFKYGVKELRKISGVDNNNPSQSERIENICRALSRAASHEVSSLEKNVPWLATTASAAPFIGLFGTVWGIMNSFQSIGATGAANLAVVAPGISEALITTATGIATAIPAVIAYNYFAGQIKKVAVDMECFSQDFINIIQRSFMSGKKGN